MAHINVGLPWYEHPFLCIAAQFAVDIAHRNQPGCSSNAHTVNAQIRRNVDLIDVHVT